MTGISKICPGQIKQNYSYPFQTYRILTKRNNSGFFKNSLLCKNLFSSALFPSLLPPTIPDFCKPVATDNCSLTWPSQKKPVLAGDQSLLRAPWPPCCQSAKLTLSLTQKIGYTGKEKISSCPPAGPRSYVHFFTLWT